VGGAVGDVVGPADGRGVGSTVGANVTMVIRSVSTTTVASAAIRLSDFACAVTSSAKLALFTTVASISLVVSALREKITSIPVAACSRMTTASPILSISAMTLPSKEGDPSPLAISLVALDDVAIVTGIAKILSSKRRCRREFVTAGTPMTTSEASSEGNAARYAVMSDALYSDVRVPSLRPSIVRVCFSDTAATSTSLASNPVTSDTVDIHMAASKLTGSLSSKVNSNGTNACTYGGVVVGAMVGISVGDGEGDSVGTSVDSVGTSVGSVGTFLGSSDGDVVGDADGLAVGETVVQIDPSQCPLRQSPCTAQACVMPQPWHALPPQSTSVSSPLRVASTHVTAVGAIVGAAVGAYVGRAVGDLLGSAVGEAVGSGVGDSLGVALGVAVGSGEGDDVGQVVLKTSQSQLAQDPDGCSHHRGVSIASRS